MPRWSGRSVIVVQEPRPREASVSATLEAIRPDTRLDSLPSDWHLPENDIDKCLSFSRVRCVMSLMSLCLLMTDIPRTGLGIEDVYQLFPVKAGPSMVMHFGPWAYPVAHIWQHAPTNNTSSESANTIVFEGKKGNNAIKTASLWSYQYDSTSIGLRGIIEFLNLSELAPDRLPRTPATSNGAPIAAALSLNTTFYELDALVSVIRSYLSSGNRDGNTYTQHEGYFAFTTEHFWIDRLHHYLYRFTKANTRWRIHSVHSYAKATDNPQEALSICSPLGRRHKPLFCEMPVEWKCTHPVNASLPKVPIWDHVDLRMAVMQRKYPGLTLDLTIFTTYNPTTSSTSAFSAYFESEVLEIVMLIRGKNCSNLVKPSARANSTTTSNSNVVSESSSSDACKTVFVDDYRYERGVLESNIAEWYPFTASLRAVAQFYVWVRLVLLFYVAYTASEDLQQRTQIFPRIISTLRTVSKIPFQVVVYGSLFPVLSYVLAHVIDCSFVDVFLETYWATVNGTTHFDLRTFARHASVQMRNVWILALLMKIVVFFQTRVMLWQPHDGIQGVRGFAISLSSILSVFGPYRSLSFRNCAIITVFALGSSTGSDRGARAMEKVKAQPISLFNISMEGLQKDMKMTLLAVCTVFAIALVAKLLLTLLRPGYLGGILFGSSIVVPYSAGVLWPTTALSARFHVSVATNPRVSYSLGPSRITPAAPGSSPSPASTNKHGAQQVHQRSQHHHHHYHPLVRLVFSNARMWVAYAFYVLVGIDRSAEKMFEEEHLSLHDHALRFEERTVEINSIVRLMNIAMMTDPWTLFRLRVLGADVYFYESTIAHRQRQREESISRYTAGINPTTGQLQHIFLLPCSPEKMLEWTGYDKDEYRLVGCMSSRDLSWSVLLQCG